MKSDLDSQQSSVNDMLAQIKKIMSQEQTNIKKQYSSNEENKGDDSLKKVPSSDDVEVIELSDSSRVDDTDILELTSESIVEVQEDNQNQEEQKKNMNTDVFNKIDTLVTSSDLESEEDSQVKVSKDSEFKVDENIDINSKIIQTNNDAVQINKSEEVDISVKNSSEQNIENHQNSNENISGNSVSKSSESNYKEGRVNLVADNVVKESTKVIKDLIDVIDKPANNSLKFRNGDTVEQLVVEIMKPQIAEWLNANLSSIVKKVVEKEVRKLIPREED